MSRANARVDIKFSLVFFLAVPGAGPEVGQSRVGAHVRCFGRQSVSLGISEFS